MKEFENKTDETAQKKLVRIIRRYIYNLRVT